MGGCSDGSVQLFFDKAGNPVIRNHGASYIMTAAIRGHAALAKLLVSDDELQSPIQ